MTKIIAGNWKMNGNAQHCLQFAEEILASPILEKTDAEIIICPPFTLLSLMADILDESPIATGAQDCSPHGAGAYTGEVSADMIAEAGADFVIVGHSERRQYHKETDDLVRAKAESALKAGMTPIICVGETLAEREAGQAQTIVKDQLTKSLPDSGDYLVAYEPVWAIGTGKTASSADIADMHGFIKTISSRPLLYGGSVKPDNAAEILKIPGVDGVLVGGASLKAEDFLAIIASAS